MEPPPPRTAPTRIVGAIVVFGIAAFLFYRAPTDRLVPETEPEPASDGGFGDPSLPPRCVAVGKPDGVLVGKGGAGDDSDFVPFAAEVGRGVALPNGGYAVGVKHQVEGVMHAAVAIVGADADKINLLALDKARGDFDAPVVVKQGEAWVAAMLEPNASGMSLRLVRVSGDEQQWGAEIEQGRDESLAYDLAFGDDVGVIAWDDVTDEEKQRGVIMTATVAIDSLEGGEDARAVSSEDVDAELPRVVPRVNGFWLAYIARSRAGSGADAGVDPEGRFRAERIQPSFIELVPLDAQGRPDGEPTAITSRDGYALAFELEPAPDGGALLTWRDDDTPSGAHGGRVTSQLVTASGAGQEQTIAEDDVGAGVPSLLTGWVAVPNRAAELALAPIAADGQLKSELRVEPLLSDGQLIAAHDDVLLVARPAGQAIRLLTVRCTR